MKANASAGTQQAQTACGKRGRAENKGDDLSTVALIFARGTVRRAFRVQADKGSSVDPRDAANPDYCLIVRVRPETSADVFLMSMRGAFKPKVLVSTPAYEGGAQLSPDGHWLLYQSDASGQPEVYVRRFPGGDRAWQVSEGRSVQPRWSRNSRELYYRSGKHVVAVTCHSR